MPSVDVVDLNNAVVGSLELSDEVFGAPVNKDLLYEAVRHSQAARRGGNAKTKTRHEVSGSGKKLWRQKGTGRARMGSIRSPLWRHGGTTHGPQPRDYSYKLPRKMLLGALRSALSAKLRDGELRVVQEFSLADHKTKAMRAVLDVLGAPKTVLVVDNGENRNLALSARNLEGVTLVSTKEVEVYRSAGPRRSAALASGGAETVGGARKMTIYEVIKRPIVTEKGVAKKDSERTLCFEVAPDANKILVKAAVEQLFKVKVADVRTVSHDRQAAAARKVFRLPVRIGKRPTSG